MIDIAPQRVQAYQLLPALDEDQRRSLRQSIETNGILQPIEVDENGRILDGHHRAAIAAELGIACPSRTIENLDEPGKRKYALTVNLMRRQIDKAARADLIAKLRGEGMTVRAIAAETGLPKSTISDDLGQLSESGQLSQPARMTGLDGRERPASRPKPEVIIEEPSSLPSDNNSVAAPLDEPTNEPAEDHKVYQHQNSHPATEELDRRSSAPAMPWPVATDTPPQPTDTEAHAARVSSDIRRLITLAQTFGSPELRAQASRLYSDQLGNAPMPPSGLVNAQELRKAADSILALAKDWNKKK